MAWKIIMPKLGMSMTEGKVVEWLVDEGERVEEGQTILRIESDKIEYEIEAPCSGVLAKILIMPSEEPIPVGQTLALIANKGEELSPGDLVSKPLETVSGTTQKELIIERHQGSDKLKASPAARKLAQAKGINLSGVKGTGPGGRITREDVEAFWEAQGKEEIAEGKESLTLGAIIPMSRRRKIISQRLGTSYSTVPHIYLFTEIDAHELQALRTKFLLRIPELSYNDILVKIVTFSIAQFPLFNATLEGDKIRILKEINIGLAVATDEGLIVPVIKGVPDKSLSDIVIERASLVQKALDNKLAFSEVEGGTFTISNLGMYGVDYFTAIINPPQTAILSVGRIRERPWVTRGELTIRPIMTLGLAADHRIVDGALAASFLSDIKEKLENNLPSISWV